MSSHIASDNVLHGRLPPFPMTRASWRATSAPKVQDSSKMPLRVGSYNIQVDHDRDVGSEREWVHRRPMAVQAVLVLDCDLLLIQEPGPGMAADLAAGLGPAFAVRTAACDPEKWAGDDAKVGQAFDGNGFVWRRSRLELLGELLSVWLSTTPDRPSKGSPAAWDSSSFCRTCVEGRFRDVRTGRTLHAISAHLDHYGKTARVESARLVMARAAAAAQVASTAVIVGGDFNTFPEYDAYGPQTYAALSVAASEAGFLDVRAAAVAHLDFGVGEDSWKGWPDARYSRAENRRNFPQPLPGQDTSRFDQMFVQSGAEIRWSGVVEEEWAAASDHVPIVAEGWA
uniref:Endonuclease/exonuclease/phosphatase domain-containing protein n=1 Tax=Calcidiscus leptoporus TaxID=127549 RepID=A0A7S0ILF9_9EUKA|mmetsp:Transcript_12567/g.28985  ORF Transcript_12567/g.28985 Transcript_12567/m.28985 type:complete len:341 (+) Transcript_12567:47-1069(+)